MTQKITLASSKKLTSTSGMPQMSMAFAGWKKPIIVQTVTITYSEGDPVKTIVATTYDGVIQPLSPKSIALKPEGQRAWKWYQVHIETTDFIAGVTDVITVDDVEYKIMAKTDYKLNNYIELHVIEDFED